MRGPFLISLSVQGHLDSRRNATLSSQVEGSTTIISLIPEGTWVVKGDVVCELDSSNFREQAKQQEITVTQAEAALAQAKEALEIQKTQNESDIAAAELQWKLALLDLDKFQNGEFLQQQKQLSGNVALASEELLRAKETHAFNREQVKKGYETQDGLEAARINVKKAELTLQGAEEELKVLENFTYKRTIAELQANSLEFELELRRVKLKAASAQTQFEKDVEAQKLTYEVEKERYERLLRQVEACTLRAPQDGEVVYANLSSGSRRSSEPEAIEEGATVRERQAIINLPDITQMKVDCRIHESLIGSIRKGLKARIRVDAYPDEFFNGEVAAVSSVPMSGRWPNTDLREYSTEIHLTDDVEKIRKLRPGLTSQVELLVDNRRNVLQIPVQAVVSIADQQLAYVVKGDSFERRTVKVGQSNSSHVEIRDGIEEGERVVLNPRTRFEAELAELAAVLNAEKEKEDAAFPDVGSSETSSSEAGPANGGGSPAASAGGAGEQRPPGGGGGDPVAFFNRLDVNKDSMLTKDEVPERMRERFAELDKNGDGKISLEEFKASRPAGPVGG